MILSITGIKGGVGKSTLTVNSSVMFAQDNYKVCIVDADKNQNCVEWGELRKLQERPVSTVDVYSCRNHDNLRNTIESLYKQYDVILIDGKPGDNDMSNRIVSVSQIIISPIKPSMFDLKTVSDFLDVIKEASSVRKAQIPIYFLFNDIKRGTIIHKRMKESFIENFGKDLLLDADISNLVGYPEAPIFGLGASEYTDFNARYEIGKLYKEIILLAQKEGLMGE